MSYSVSTKRTLDAHHAARSRHRAIVQLWHDLRALLPRWERNA